jgi:hypothetical protein
MCARDILAFHFEELRRWRNPQTKPPRLATPSSIVHQNEGRRIQETHSHQLYLDNPPFLD